MHWLRDRARFAPWVVCLVVAVGPGCTSDDDEPGGASGSGGSGGGSTRNVYVAEVPGMNCLPRPLTLDANGQVPCQLVETVPKTDAPCACDATHGRVPLRDPTVVVPAIDEYLRNTGACGTDQTPRCGELCYCGLAQFSGEQLLTCEGAAEDPGTQYGFCYVDPQIDSNADGTPDANPKLLAECSDTTRRRLRFMGADLPAANATMFLTCEGQSASD